MKSLPVHWCTEFLPKGRDVTRRSTGYYDSICKQAKYVNEAGNAQYPSLPGVSSICVRWVSITETSPLA